MNEAMKDAAELVCRRYFDRYLNNVFPQQMHELECRLNKRVEAKLQIHDINPTAHGGVQHRFDRMFWLLLGIATAGGGGLGAGIARFIDLI